MTVVRLNYGAVRAAMRVMTPCSTGFYDQVMGNRPTGGCPASPAGAIVRRAVADETIAERAIDVCLRAVSWWRRVPECAPTSAGEYADWLQRSERDLVCGVSPLLVLERVWYLGRQMPGGDYVTNNEFRRNAVMQLLPLGFALDIDILDCVPRYAEEVIE